MVTDPRQIRGLGSGFSQVDSVFHKNYTAGCVHGVRARLTYFWGKRNRPGKNPIPNVGFHVKPRLSTPSVPTWALLCVCYLENHVFLGTRIDRKISARDVFIDASCRRTSSGQDKPNSFFVGAHGQELSVPRHSIQPSFNPHYDAPKYGDR